MEVVTNALDLNQTTVFNVQEIQNSDLMNVRYLANLITINLIIINAHLVIEVVINVLELNKITVLNAQEI